MLLSQNVPKSEEEPKIARTRACKSAIGAEASEGTKLTSGKQLSNPIVQGCCLNRLVRVAHFGVLFCIRVGGAGDPYIENKKH